MQFIKAIKRISTIKKGYFTFDYYLFRIALSRHLRIKTYDLIQVELPTMIGLVKYLPANTVKVYVAHTIIYKMIEQDPLTFGNPKAQNVSTSAKKEELELMSRYDGILTLSEIDKDILSVEIKQPRIFYSPSGVNFSFFKPRSLPKRYDKIIFLCNMDHHPNVDALFFFFKNIYPHLYYKIQKTRIYITGRCSGEFQAQFPNKQNIVWTGFVEDIRELLKDAISIAPIRIGTGIRVKLLESMLFECPVVSTRIGIQGIPYQSYVDSIVEDDSKKFAEAILFLRDNWKIANKLGVNARKRIVAHFGEEKIRKCREAAYCNIMEAVKKSAL